MSHQTRGILLWATGACLVSVLVGLGPAASAASMLPTVKKLAPASGPPGVPVTISGTNLQGATSVTFGGTAAQFSVSSKTITAVVPAGAVTGTVAVTTAAGTGTSAKPFTVLVPKPPAIASFAPLQLLSGTVVTITGTAFLGASAVSFNGKPAQSFAVAGDTRITAIVDPGTTPGKVSVTTFGGTAQSQAAYTVPSSVWLDSCIRASGHADVLIGRPIVFRAAWSMAGPSFLKQFLKNTVMTVYFNGLTITKAQKYWDPVGQAYPQGGWISYFAFDGGIAPSPEGATTEGGLEVVAKKQLSDGFATYLPGTQFWDGKTCFVRSIPLAEFGSATPGSGPVGQTVTITGQHLNYVTGVKFGGVSAPFTTPSIYKITTHIPRGATTGPIELDEEGLATISSPTAYSVDQTPLAFDSFSPAAGAVGTTVTVHGSGLYRVTAVKFGSVDAPTFAASSDTTLNVTVPASAHSSTITVFEPDGQKTSSSSYTVVVPGGKLDVGFGTNGVARIDIPSRTDSAYAVAVDADGKLLVTGRSELTATQTGPALMRLDPDGSLDSSFGSGGIAIGDFGDARYFKAWGITVLGDGKILVTGTSGYGATDGGQKFAVVRYLHDGTVDTGFGVGGVATVGFMTNYTYGSSCGVMRSLAAVDAAGNIVLAGRACSDVGIARFLPDGTLDSTFAYSGVLLVDTRPTGSIADVTSVFVRPDGKIVVGGTGSVSSSHEFFAIRLAGDGTLDSGFGSGGTAFIPETSGSSSYAAALDSAGNLFLAGGKDGPPNIAFTVVKLGADGALKPGFGIGGIGTIPYPSGGAPARGIVIAPDGKLLVAGGGAVGRYDADGSPDATFGQTSAGLTIGPTGAKWLGAVRLPSGRFVAAGSQSGLDGFSLGAYDVVATPVP